MGIKVVVGFLAIVLAVLLQHYISIAGIAPNFVFAVLAALLFFIPGFFTYAFLVLFAVLLLRIQPGLDLESTVITLIFLLLFLGRDSLPWRPFISFIVIAASAPIMFYIVVDPSFIFQSFYVFGLEVVYTIVAGIIAFIFLYDGQEQRRI